MQNLSKKKNNASSFKKPAQTPNNRIKILSVYTLRYPCLCKQKNPQAQRPWINGANYLKTFYDFLKFRAISKASFGLNK